MRIKTHIKHNLIVYMAVGALLFCGLLFGLAAPVTMEETTTEQIKTYIGNYLQTLPDASLDQVGELWRAFRFNGLLLLLVFLFGMHLLGIGGITAVLIYKGFTLGYAMGFLLNYQGISGFLIILFSILPQNLLFLPVLAYFSIAASAQSITLWQSSVFSFGDKKNNLLLYGKTFFLSGVITFLGAVLQGYLCPLLLKLLFIIL
ncbi:MAG: stage II sporulation protein M [Clostridiales bacterium]